MSNLVGARRKKNKERLSPTPIRLELPTDTRAIVDGRLLEDMGRGNAIGNAVDSLCVYHGA